MGRDLAQFGILAIGESLVILTGGIDLSVGALPGPAGILAAWFNVNAGLPARWRSWSPSSICAGDRALARDDGHPAEGAAVRHHAGDVHRRPGPRRSRSPRGTPINGIDPLFGNLSSFYVERIPVPALFFVGAAVIALVRPGADLRRPADLRRRRQQGGGPAGRHPDRRAGSPPRTSRVPCSPARRHPGDRPDERRGPVASAPAGNSSRSRPPSSAVSSLFGGEGRIVGIAAGAILLEFIANGLLALHVSPYYQQVVQGGVLGVAILLDRLRASYFKRGR